MEKNSGKIIDRSPMPEDFHSNCSTCISRADRERQYKIERGSANTDRVIKENATKVADFVSRQAKKVFNEENKAKVGRAIASFDSAVSDFDDALVRGYSWAENKSAELTSRVSNNDFEVDGKKAVASSVIVSTAFSAAPVAALPFNQDQDAIDTFSSVAMADPKIADITLKPDSIHITYKPDALPVTGHQDLSTENSTQIVSADVEPAAKSYENPLVRTIRSGETISHFAKSLLGENATEERMQQMISEIYELNDIDATKGEEKTLAIGQKIKLPVEINDYEIHKVTKGEKAGVLYRELGWEEAGYTFDEFLSKNAIVDKNFIRIGWTILKPQVKAPSSSEVSTTNGAIESDLIEDIEAVPEEAEAAVIDTKEVLTKEEAVVAVDELIAVVSTVEEPLLLMIQDQPVSTVAERLEADKEEIVEQLQNGATNLAYVQSESLQEVVYENPNFDLHDVARLAVRSIYQEHGIDVPHEVISDQASEVIKGVEPGASMIQSLILANDSELDFESDTLFNLKARIETDFENKVLEITHAGEVLGEISEIELDDDQIGSLSAIAISQELYNEKSGDAYYVLASELYESEIGVVIRSYVDSIYDSYMVDELLNHSEYSREIDLQINTVLEGDHVELGSYLQDAKTELESILSQATEETSPVFAEVIHLLPDTDNLGDEVFRKLVAEKILGATDAQLKMGVLVASAESQGVTLAQEVERYYQEAYKSYGLVEYASQEHLDAHVKQTIDLWEENQTGFSYLNASVLIESEIDREAVLLGERVAPYLDVAEISESDERILNLIIDSMNQTKSETSVDIELIKLLAVDAGTLNTSVELYLQNYYENNEAAQHLTDIELSEISKSIIANERDAQSFVEALKQYSGIPSELFPGGTEFVLSDYNEQDLLPLIEALGISKEDILESAFNSHLVISDGKLISTENPTIWLGEVSQSYDDLIEIYRSEVLKIVPEPVVIEVEKPVAEQHITNSIEGSLDKVEVEDRINYLDRTVEEVISWYSSIKDSDPHRLDEMPDGYVRMPFHDELEDFNLAYTRSAKAAPVETYAAPETIAVALGAAELWHQIIETKFPQYSGSMLRFRDFNSAHHRTHDDGRHIDVSTHNSAEISEASTGPAMDFISGDGTNNEYNFELNAAYAVALASLNVSGKRAISSILSSDAKLVAEVNRRLGYKFMSDVDYHGEHWHINTNKAFSLPDFNPESPFDELGHKGDLGIGGEYQDIPEEMHEEEHGQVEEALEELTEEEVSSLREEAEEEEAPEVVEEVTVEKTSSIDVDKQKVYEARTTEELINLGFTSLEKIPEKDKKALDKLLSQLPSAEEAIDQFNARQGDPRGPKIPGTAVLAMAYDLNMRDDDLIDTVTTLRGESIGFSVFVVGDDKRPNNEDEPVNRAAFGLGQFFVSNEDGLSEAQLDEHELYLHPGVALMRVVEFKQSRGLDPWYFYQHRDIQMETWDAHKDKVLASAEVLEAAGLNVIP